MSARTNQPHSEDFGPDYDSEDRDELDYAGPLDCTCPCATRMPCVRDDYTGICRHCEDDHA